MIAHKRSPTNYLVYTWQPLPVRNEPQRVHIARLKKYHLLEQPPPEKPPALPPPPQPKPILKSTRPSSVYLPPSIRNRQQQGLSVSRGTTSQPPLDTTKTSHHQDRSTITTDFSPYPEPLALRRSSRTPRIPLRYIASFILMFLMLSPAAT